MAVAWLAEHVSTDSVTGEQEHEDAAELVERLFTAEGANLVRLTRFFVDDRDAAEDLVQEAFIRLARSAHRINDPARAPAYLRSIVLNLARDHNRRGLVSLRHRMRPDAGDSTLDEIMELRGDQIRVIEALRSLPRGQRNCLVLRYYLDLSNLEISETLGISVNTVKTQLKRGLTSLGRVLGDRQ
jgi:RNA polymerase sigma-70 factor (sigma-E family)